MAELADSSGLLAYAAIVRGDAKWLLLAQPENVLPHDKLVLEAQGSEDLSELKRNVKNPNRVFIAFYREDVGGKPGYLLINYIPPAVTAVQRARTIVYSRRLGTVFAARQTTLTIENLGDLTQHAIIQALTQSDNPVVIQTARTMSQSSAWSADRHFHHDMPASPSSSTNESIKQPSSPISKTAGKISKLLGRKKKHGSLDSSEADEPPPPPPPKDAGVYSYSYSHTRFMSTQALPSPTSHTFHRERVNSLSDFGVLREEEQLPRSPPKPLLQSHNPRIFTPTHSLPSKWARNSLKTLTNPSELSRQRQEAQQLRALEMERARSEEAERQALRARQKEEARRLEQEEEERRRQSLEEEMRRVKAIKQQKAELERINEERRRLAMEEKKRIEKERRFEEHMRLESWRIEQARMAEEAAWRQAEAKMREKEAKREQIQKVEKQVRGNLLVEDLVTGWITLQMDDSLTWKRRYYRFSENGVAFYRDPKDARLKSKEIKLRGRIKALREWDEGFDELKAIPHSFGVEFEDGQEPWSIYADTEDEKIKVMGLLYHVGGLKD